MPYINGMVISRDLLKSLVNQGKSQRAIAAQLDISQTSVRRYLDLYNLKTTTDSASKKPLPANRSGKTEIREFDCFRHGLQTHLLYPKSSKWLCSQCVNDYSTKAKRLKKQTLVNEAGGKCSSCHKKFHASQFDFHHLDPSAKKFTLSSRGASYGIKKLRNEAAKCTLLCVNCHREAEDNLSGPASDRATLRRKQKERLLEGRGCQVCGYARSGRALEFHHLDPSTKEFHLSHDNMDRNIEPLKKEAAKCIVLCANCHRAVEAGKVHFDQTD